MYIYELKWRVETGIASKDEIEYYTEYVVWMKKKGFIKSN
jgi:hypothetical protein